MLGVYIYNFKKRKNILCHEYGLLCSCLFIFNANTSPLLSPLSTSASLCTFSLNLTTWPFSPVHQPSALGCSAVSQWQNVSIRCFISVHLCVSPLFSSSDSLSSVGVVALTLTVQRRKLCSDVLVLLIISLFSGTRTVQMTFWKWVSLAYNSTLTQKLFMMKGCLFPLFPFFFSLVVIFSIFGVSLFWSF